MRTNEGHKHKNSQKQNKTKQKHRQSSDLQPHRGFGGQGGESYFVGLFGLI